MAALLANPAMFENNNEVSFLNCCQAMGNHNHCSAKHGLLEPNLNGGLRLCIEGTGGFIQQHHCGITQHCSGNGNALELSP